jgi:uncharacterized protein (TIGR03067 family)
MLVFVLTLPAAAPASADVVGVWRPVTAELGGAKLPDAAIASWRLTLTKTTYALTGAESADKGTVTSDAKHVPKTMDITGTEGPNAGKTFLAIYELDGDRLTVCYDLSEKTRPTRFETKPGTKLFLVTYRRERPETR